MINDLSHLHQAMRHTGLTADIQSPLSVSSRLAQTIYHTLQANHASIAKQLVQDLHTLADMGYLTWQKRGSARTYALTPRGSEIAST